MSTGLRAIPLIMSVTLDLHRVGRCSLLLASQHLFLSSCHTVRYTAGLSSDIPNTGNPLASSLHAPPYHIAATPALMSPSRGAVSIHHSCSVQACASTTRKKSSSHEAGAAVSHPLYGKARRWVHEFSPCHLWPLRSFVPFPLRQGQAQIPYQVYPSAQDSPHLRATRHGNRKYRPLYRAAWRPPETSRQAVDINGGSDRPSGRAARAGALWKTPRQRVTMELNGTEVRVMADHNKSGPPVNGPLRQGEPEAQRGP
jgi:hypothetical protein